MAHPYILNPATKAQALYYDNRSGESPYEVCPKTNVRTVDFLYQNLKFC